MNAIHGADLPFDEFLEAAKELIIEKKGEYGLMLLGNLVLPYIRHGQWNADLFEAVEEEVLSRKENLTPMDIISLLQAFSMANLGTEELYMYFDKIVGKNISAIDTKMIVPILMSFAQTQYSREKLFVLFH